MFSYAGEVKRGAEWLDSVKPEWFNEIDINKLDMCYANSCVLGQLDLVNGFLKVNGGLADGLWDQVYCQYGFTTYEASVPSLLRNVVPYEVIKYSTTLLRDSWIEEIKKREDNQPKRKFKVACSWEVYGDFEVEATTLDEAYEKCYDLDLPEGEYVDDSFKLTPNCSEVLNEKTGCYELVCDSD